MRPSDRVRCRLYDISFVPWTDVAITGLKKLNDWPTYPQLIINGELIGGLDITKEMVDSGELNELLA